MPRAHGVCAFSPVHMREFHYVSLMSPLMEVFLLYVSPALSPCLQRKPQAPYFIAFMEIYLDLIPKKKM